MLIKEVPIESLGNHSYLLVSREAGVAAVIDPARDVDRYITEAEALGVRIVYALETHLHNDFLSGSRELTSLTGAEVGAPAAGGLLHPHIPLQEGDTLTLGELRIGVIHTPGHTPEHVSYTVTDASDGKTPKTIFSGGALMVGGAARVDLLGERLAPFLAKWLYHTLYGKFLSLPDDLAVYPTHGGGSFCSAASSAGDVATTTIGQERLSNPLLRADGEEEFVTMLLSNLSSYPLYYKRMASINRKGPPLLGDLPALAPLTAQEVHQGVEMGAFLVDLRDTQAFGQAHVPGAYAIPFSNSLSTWIGWVIPWASQLTFLSGDPAHHEEVVRQLIRIGYDNLVGYLEGGIEAWKAAEYPVGSVPSITAEELRGQLESPGPPLLLDVRQRAEWRAGRMPGALNIELGELQEHLDGLPRDIPLVSACAAGVRATTAASILLRDGFINVSLLTGGTDAWLREGYPVEQGADPG